MCACHEVLATQTKANLLIDIELGAHASRHAVGRAAKGRGTLWAEHLRTAELQSRALMHDRGQVPEGTIGLAMRVWSFGRCMTTCTRAIWREKFGSDAHQLLSWSMQKWKPVGVVISRNRG